MPDCSGLRLACEVERWIHAVQVSHSGGLAVKLPPKQLCSWRWHKSGSWLLQSLSGFLNYLIMNIWTHNWDNVFSPGKQYQESRAGLWVCSHCPVTPSAVCTAPHAACNHKVCFSGSELSVSSKDFELSQSRKSQLVRSCCRFPKQPCPPHASDLLLRGFSLRLCTDFSKILYWSCDLEHLNLLLILSTFSIYVCAYW